MARAGEPRGSAPKAGADAIRAIGLAIFEAALRKEADLAEFRSCEPAAARGAPHPPGLNAVAAGRCAAIRRAQRAAIREARLAEACNTALNVIEHATIAGPARHGDALVTIGDLLAGALAPPSHP